VINSANYNELDKHREQRRQRLQQAVGALPSSDEVGPGPGVRRGGSVESDRDGSTDGSASASTDTDHEHNFITVCLLYSISSNSSSSNNNNNNTESALLHAYHI